MESFKKLFMLAAVILLLVTMFDMEDLSAVFSILGDGLANAMNAFSNAE